MSDKRKFIYFENLSYVFLFIVVVIFSFKGNNYKTRILLQQKNFASFTLINSALPYVWTLVINIKKNETNDTVSYVSWIEWRFSIQSNVARWKKKKNISLILVHTRHNVLMVLKQNLSIEKIFFNYALIKSKFTKQSNRHWREIV